MSQKAKPLTTIGEHVETIRTYVLEQEEPSDFVLDALRSIGLEEAAKDEALADAVRTPALLAWRAGSPHGFSRVYAENEAQARERGAVAQRCDASVINVDRWPEEDLCKAKQVAERDATVKALAESLDEQRATHEDQEWHSAHCMRNGRASCTEDCERARAALRLVGR